MLVLDKIFTNIDEEELKKVKSQCGLRRADRFTSLALAAVKLAFPEQFPQFLPKQTGLITASSFGPHKTVFSTLDDILDFPEDQILPTKFSHSVHNAAASYLTTVLKINGPAFAITNFENPFEEAVNLANTLLNGKMCPGVLLIALDETGTITNLATSCYPERFPAPPKEFARVLYFTA